MLEIITNGIMTSSGMDISESFRPEDLGKTDFFDFVGGAAAAEMTVNGAGATGRASTATATTTTATLTGSTATGGQPSIPSAADRPPGGPGTGGGGSKNGGPETINGSQSAGSQPGSGSGGSNNNGPGSNQPLQGFDQVSATYHLLFFFWGRMHSSSSSPH